MVELFRPGGDARSSPRPSRQGMAIRGGRRTAEEIEEFGSPGG